MSRYDLVIAADLKVKYQKIKKIDQVNHNEPIKFEIRFINFNRLN